MKRLLLLFVIVNGAFVLRAQDYGKSVIKPITVQKVNEWTFPTVDGFDGTYQFIVKEKKNFIFTDETFKMIEDARKDDQDVVLTLSPFLDVLILSNQKMANPSGMRFTEIYKLN